MLEDRVERFDAYAASWLAIAASGTVSLEAALAGLPLITIYRTGPLSAWLARRLITVSHVNLVNLILGRPAVPELLQEDCRPECIAATATAAARGRAACAASQQAALAEAVTRLGGVDGRPPSQRAAARVLEIMADDQPEDRMASDADNFRLLHSMLEQGPDRDAALRLRALCVTDLAYSAADGGRVSSIACCAIAAVDGSPPPATVTVGKANLMPLASKAFLIMP